MADANAIFQTTACKVAIELGYSKNAIIHCYENGMRAGDLVSKILDLESINPNFQNELSEDEVNNKISRDYSELCRKLNEIDLSDNLSDNFSNNLREEKKLNEADLHDLREETKRLWAKFQCKSCGVNKSNRLALPCTHLVTCEKCMSDKCVICRQIVTDWIEVFI